MRRATAESLRTAGSRPRPGTVAVGDYLHSERDLYRVEQLSDGHALIENCRTGDLVDMSADQLAALDRLER